MKKLTIFTVAVCLVTATTGFGANLIVNGDFEAGSIAPATTEYYLETAYGTWTMGEEGEYAVDTNPHLFHSAWASYGDHTTGSGKMLIVNAAYNGSVPPYGDISGIEVVWEQTVPVTPGKNYLLSYWLSSAYHTNLAEIQCSINGTPLSPTADAPAAVGVWQEVSYTWNSGLSASATITLKDLTRIASGDDFAIDDISLLQERCETAFALGDDATCFTDLGFKNWGWSNEISDGESLTWPLWAGAGQCDTGKGMLVGSVDVAYNDASDTVVVNIDLDEGYTLCESHVYAGDAQVPKNKKGKPTVAPGQYYIEADLVDEIYVIVHAVVCWFE